MTTITRLDLNPILLQHIQRFFSAARTAVETSMKKDALSGGVAALVGNVIWAGSGFCSADRAEEHQKAYTGALISSLGDRFIAANDDELEQQALRALGALEKQLLKNYDPLLERIFERLQAHGLLGLSPGELNVAVWCALFPGFDYYSSQAELIDALGELVQGTRVAA